MILRIDRLSDREWVVKDSNYETVEHLTCLEDKLEYLRKLVNYFLEEQDK